MLKKGSSLTEAEQKIKETAKDIFFRKGHLHATMQDIADAAGITRALIHYYFRSREQLVLLLFQEALVEIQEKTRSVFSGALSFKDKMAHFISVFLARSLEYPYLELFVITEVNRRPELFLHMITQDAERQKLFELVAQEMAEGRLAPMKPEQFMLNVVALCNFPILGRPITQKIFGIDDEGYAAFLQERKDIILSLVFRE